MVALALSCSLPPNRAHAYCRASDEVGPGGACVPEPDAPFLFWSRACTAYHFNRSLFSRLNLLSETEIRRAFSDAFGAWAAVDCRGRAPFFVQQSPGTTATSRSEFLRDAPNEMVVLALPAERWAELPDHSPSAIALTLLWHSTSTGEIYDTDMELNLSVGSFADCVARSCEAGMLDLQNTITHEAGHVLGLGHSSVVTSTMAPQAHGPVDTQKRSLEADDRAGYCALDLPEWRCAGADCSCPVAPALDGQAGLHISNSAGCQLTGRRGSGGSAPCMGFVSLLAWLATRHTRRRGRRSQQRGRSAATPWTWKGGSTASR